MTNSGVCVVKYALILALTIVTSARAEFTCTATVESAASGSTVRAGKVEWKNTAPSGIAAPYVRVEAEDGVLIRFTESDAWGKSIEFLATSSTSPAGTLKANESGTVTFLCDAASDDGKLTLSWTLGSSDAFPWADLGPSLKPSYVADGAWTFALQTLKSRFGQSWDSYLDRLRSDATYLADLGRPVNRLDRLWQIEISRALGVDSVLPVLASGQDAACPARGLSLSFTRAYSSAMYGRFNSGMLGYGWTDNLSVYAELTDSTTLVFRTPGGGSYAFSKETGSWQPEDARDRTVLTETASAYTLTYQNGTKQTFAKSNLRTSSIADNSGNTLTFSWNGTVLQKVVHTDGQSLTFSYSNGLLSSVSDDCGRTTRYAYADSLLVKVTGYDGLATSYEYRPADGTASARALSRIVHPDGTTREFAYGADGLVAAVSVNGGMEKTTIARNEGVITITEPDGAVTTVKTGVAGEDLETTDAFGGVSTKEYEEDGLLRAVVSPSGLSGAISHDALGRVSKSVSTANVTTAFAYDDTFGNLTTVTDAKNQTLTYGYDAKGRGTSVTFADGSSATLEYNPRGDVTKSTNRRGETIDYTYDSKGRLTKTVWSNGRTFTYVYDALDNIISASDSETGTVTMEYDTEERLTQITYPTGRGFTFAYDICGRLTMRSSLDGVTEKFTYDDAGRIAKVTDGNNVAYLQHTYD